MRIEIQDLKRKEDSIDEAVGYLDLYLKSSNGPLKLLSLALSVLED